MWDKDLPKGRGFQAEKLSRGPECPHGSSRAQLSQAWDPAARPARLGRMGGVVLPPPPAPSAPAAGGALSSRLSTPRLFLRGVLLPLPPRQPGPGALALPAGLTSHL